MSKAEAQAVTAALQNIAQVGSTTNGDVKVLLPMLQRIAGFLVWKNRRETLKDDLIQEFVIRLPVLAKKYNPVLAPDSFLMGCMHNVLRDIVRKFDEPPDEQESRIDEAYKDVSVEDFKSSCAEDEIDRKFALNSIVARLNMNKQPVVQQRVAIPLVQVGDSMGVPTEPSKELRAMAKRRGPSVAGLTEGGSRLREIRTLLGMQMDTFADALGVYKTTLTSYEYGRTLTVPQSVMDRAEALMAEAEKDEIYCAYKGLGMDQILGIWSQKMGLGDSPDIGILSEVLNVSKSALSRWNNGLQRPSMGDIANYHRIVQRTDLGDVAKLQTKVRRKLLRAAAPRQTTDAQKARASRLREIRRECNKTQAGFAVELGLRPATYLSYEYGRTRDIPAEVMEEAERIYAQHSSELNQVVHYRNMAMSEILAEWLKIMGLEANETAVLAQLLGTTKGTVSRWMNGITRPPTSSILRYAKLIRQHARRLAAA